MEYIEKHPDMDESEKEVISNTIMDALVYKGLIKKYEETLDLDNLCIKKVEIILNIKKNQMLQELLYG